MNIRQIFNRFDVKFKEHGDHHHATVGRIQMDCPQCSPGSGHFRLSWHLTNNYFNCWHCGPMRLHDTFMQLTGETFSDSRKLLQDLIPEEDLPKEGINYSRRVVLPEGVGNLKPAHRNYLKERGFEDLNKLQELWGVQGIDHTGGPLSWRIFIPVIYDGVVVSWTTRSIMGNASRRYRSAELSQEKIPHKHLLYGEDKLNKSKLLLFEAPLSVWTVGPGSAALFGLGYNNKQVRRIARFSTIYVCFDNTPDAQETALELCDHIKVLNENVFNIELETGKDPGEINEKELKKLRSLLQ